MSQLTELSPQLIVWRLSIWNLIIIALHAFICMPGALERQRSASAAPTCTTPLTPRHHSYSIHSVRLTGTQPALRDTTMSISLQKDQEACANIAHVQQVQHLHSWVSKLASRHITWSCSCECAGTAAAKVPCVATQDTPHFIMMTRRLALVALDAQAPPPVRPSSARGWQHTQCW